MAINPNILIAEGRLSFPALFRAKAFDEAQEPSFGCSVILDKKKHAKVIEKLNQLVDQLAKEAFKGKIPANFRHPLRDGSVKADTDGYGPNVVFFSCKNKKRVPLVDRDGTTPVAEEDGKLTAGFYCNFSVRAWVQDNKWGKAVNFQLRAVQFVRGEAEDAFGEAPVDVSKEFKNLEGDDDDESSFLN